MRNWLKLLKNRGSIFFCQILIGVRAAGRRFLPLSRHRAKAGEDVVALRLEKVAEVRMV